MVIFAKESKLANLFAKRNDVMAYTYGKKVSKELRAALAQSPEKVEVTYIQPDFIPTADEINAMLDGTLKVSKMVKRTLKSITSLKSGDEGLKISLFTSVRCLRERKNVIMAFVMLEDDNDERARAINKLMFRYVSMLFNELGISVLGDVDVSKKFKKSYNKYTKILEEIEETPKKKIRKKLRSKAKAIYKTFDRDIMDYCAIMDIIATGKRKLIKTGLEKYLNRYACDLSKGGTAVMNRIHTMMRIPLVNTSLNAVGAAGLKSKRRLDVSEALLDNLMGKNVNSVNRMDPGKGESAKKMAKAIIKMDKSYGKAYNKLRKVMLEIGKGMESKKDRKAMTLPKFKFGHKKAMTNKDIEKFHDYFTDKRHLASLVAVCSHLTCDRFDVDVTSPEYEKAMVSSVSSVDPDNGATMAKLIVAGMKQLEKADSAK